jgi:hypothetical protein
MRKVLLVDLFVFILERRPMHLGVSDGGMELINGAERIRAWCMAN